MDPSVSRHVPRWRRSPGVSSRPTVPVFGSTAHGDPGPVEVSQRRIRREANPTRFFSGGPIGDENGCIFTLFLGKHLRNAFKQIAKGREKWRTQRANVAPCFVQTFTRWFQTIFIFTPTWGNDPIWPIFFKGCSFLESFGQQLRVAPEVNADWLRHGKETYSFLWVN